MVRTILYRRRREGKTDYRRRLILLTSRKPRLVIRMSNSQLYLQLVEYRPAGDKVVSSLHSSALEKFGWKFSKNSLPAAYLAGYLFGRRVNAEVVLDLGMYSPACKGRVYACVKGLVDAGAKFPVDKVVFPDEARIRGEHIVANSVGNYSGYAKKGVDVSSLTAVFDRVKKEIENEG